MVFRRRDLKGGSWQYAGGILQPPWLFRRKANPDISVYNWPPLGGLFLFGMVFRRRDFYAISRYKSSIFRNSNGPKYAVSPYVSPYWLTERINCSILAALSRFIWSVTCPYTSRVKEAVAWPKFSCTVLMSSPDLMLATALEFGITSQLTDCGCFLSF